MNSGIAPAGTSRRGVDIAPSSKSVYEINPLSDPRWDALIERHPRASVFHSTNWLRSLQRTYGYDPVAVTTCGPTAVLTNGLVFCRVKSW